MAKMDEVFDINDEMNQYLELKKKQEEDHKSDLETTQQSNEVVSQNKNTDTPGKMKCFSDSSEEKDDDKSCVRQLLFQNISMSLLDLKMSYHVQMNQEDDDDNDISFFIKRCHNDRFYTTTLITQNAKRETLDYLVHIDNDFLECSSEKLLSVANDFNQHSPLLMAIATDSSIVFSYSLVTNHAVPAKAVTLASLIVMATVDAFCDENESLFKL